MPVHQGFVDKDYETERAGVQKSFMTVLSNDFDAPYSKTFSAYVISSSIFVWLCGIISTMSVFYVTVRIRHPNDNFNSENTKRRTRFFV